MISQFNLNFVIESPYAYAIGDQKVEKYSSAKVYVPTIMTMIEKRSEVVSTKQSLNSANIIFVNDVSCRPVVSSIIEETNYIEIRNKTNDNIELKDGEQINCYSPLKSVNSLYF